MFNAYPASWALKQAGQRSATQCPVPQQAVTLCTSQSHSISTAMTTLQLNASVPGPLTFQRKLYYVSISVVAISSHERLLPVAKPVQVQVGVCTVTLHADDLQVPAEIPARCVFELLYRKVQAMRARPGNTCI